MNATSLNVLYANQTTDVSGAEVSLLELLGGLPSDVNATLASPPGELAVRARAMGVPTVGLAATDLSFRLHPVHTLRGLSWIPRAGWSLRSLARRTGSEIVHANSTRAGLAAVAAARFGGPPAVVHVRDWVPEGRVARATLRTIEVGAAAIITNSDYVAKQLPQGARACRVHVIHNPLDASRFQPEAVSRSEARARLGLSPDSEVLVLIAHFVPWKGQEDALRALARVKRSRADVRLLLVGSAKFTAAGARYDSPAYEASVRELAGSLGIAEDVHFLGERKDIPQILAAADLLLVPSWQEAFGRVVLEGMAMRLPVLATSKGGPAEVVRDGVDGALLAPRDPALWADAIEQLLADPDGRKRMGASGRARVVGEFDPVTHAERVRSVYAEVVGR